MSYDLKMMAASTDDLEDPGLEWQPLNYVSVPVRCGGYDAICKLTAQAVRIYQEDGTEIRTHTAYVVRKNGLDIFNQHAEVRDQLIECLADAVYPWIIIQPF